MEDKHTGITSSERSCIKPTHVTSLKRYNPFISDLYTLYYTYSCTKTLSGLISCSGRPPRSTIFTVHFSPVLDIGACFLSILGSILVLCWTLEPMMASRVVLHWTPPPWWTQTAHKTACTNQLLNLKSIQNLPTILT